MSRIYKYLSWDKIYKSLVEKAKTYNIGLMFEFMDNIWSNKLLERSNEFIAFVL